MKLSEIRDYFKEEFGWNDSISIGKIDNNQDKAICFYDSSRQLAYIGAIGNKKTTSIKPITILLRYTKNQNSAETKAQNIYDFFENKVMEINNKRAFVMMQTENPISLGTDESNIYEYSFEIDIYYER